MNPLRAFLKRLSGLFTTSRHEQEFNAELESHLQLHTDENIRAGMSPEAARREAILKLGGLEPTRQGPPRTQHPPLPRNHPPRPPLRPPPTHKESRLHPHRSSHAHPRHRR